MFDLSLGPEELEKQVAAWLAAMDAGFIEEYAGPYVDLLLGFDLLSDDERQAIIAAREQKEGTP